MHTLNSNKKKIPSILLFALIFYQKTCQTINDETQLTILFVFSSYAEFFSSLSYKTLWIEKTNCFWRTARRNLTTEHKKQYFNL